MLFKRQPDYVDGEMPFKNDLFERKQLAEKLSTYIDRLNDGCVVGIDAPWGEGKTYFGRNWAAMLALQEYKTIYLDAFEEDYTDDPFLLISAKILAALTEAEPDESWSRFHDACVKAGKVLLPATAKITVNALGRLFLGINDIAEIKEKFGDQIEEKLGDATEKYVKQRLDDYDRDRETAEHFKTALREFAAKQDKPVVFIIDELDRCRPSFAVQVIERIKHFFDTPNLVFVLLLNRAQLENAINGVYGSELDAHAYLGKFVHFFLRLPKRVDLAGHKDFNKAYCTHLASHYKFQRSDAFEAFTDTLSLFGNVWELSYRDLEKAFIHFVMAQPIGLTAPLAAYLIAMKLKHQSIFNQIAAGNSEGHNSALPTISKLMVQYKDHWLLPGIQALHQAAIAGKDNRPPEFWQNHSWMFIGSWFRPESLLINIANKLDITFVE